MSNSNNRWNPLSTHAWAEATGLAHVPLYGPARTQTTASDCAVLLDGRRHSLGMYTEEDSERLVYSSDPLSWSWSANLRHSFILTRNAAIYRRWDLPDRVTRYELPSTPLEAIRLFEKVGSERAVTSSDVISRLLTTFRQVRANLAAYDSDPVAAIQVFNALLVGTEMARRGKQDENAWRNCRTIGEALDMVSGGDSSVQVGKVPTAARETPATYILNAFIDPDPHTKCQLDPYLLIRHASGVLYQEAHFQLEREGAPYLPGLAPPRKPALKSQVVSDARFTPPPLARAMVEQAVAMSNLFEQDHDNIVILDPACGSGVFLQQILQELSRIGHRGRVKLVGCDTSAVSCAIAKFCLNREARDVAKDLDVEVDVSQTDALTNDWPESDLVLMNPPFAAWRKMPGAEREQVKTVLGNLFKGHSDKAMAFVWKGVQALRPNGILASVVPSPFLESNAGERWRAAIAERANIGLIGRFGGFSYFQNAMVEPAFFVLRRKSSDEVSPIPTRVVLAREGHEEDALRVLRRNPDGTGLGDDPDVSVFTSAPGLLTPASWLPRSQRRDELISRLAKSKMTTIGELFDVKQGAITGKNSAFIVSSAVYRSLPESERAYFRAAAGTPTIREGRLLAEEYVFYPYSEDGTVAITIDTLVDSLPTFYRTRLRDEQLTLASRAGVNPAQWWLLTWPRTEIHASCQPKIVTSYFGSSGSFAYDNRGDFVVVQGYVWLWRHPEQDTATEYMSEDGEPELKFHKSHLPWAYTAILNSGIFESLLSLSCPRVQGGQYNLSTRFVTNAYLPDLSDENTVTGDDVRDLGFLGRALAEGNHIDIERLNRVVANAYGIPLAAWDLDARGI